MRHCSTPHYVFLTKLPTLNSRIGPRGLPNENNERKQDVHSGGIPVAYLPLCCGECCGLLV